MYNKHQKEKYDASKDHNKKPEYNTWMYGPESANILAKSIDWEGTDVYKKLHSLAKPKLTEHDVDEDQLLRSGIQEHQSSLESLSKQDEIIFNILKWIFNAIKKEHESVNKTELLNQLKNNGDTMKSLGFRNIAEFDDAVNSFPTSQQGYFTWEEFIDFFISKSGLGDQKGEWWKTFLSDMDSKDQRIREAEFYNSPQQKHQRLADKAYLQSSDQKKLKFDINENDQQKFKKLTSSRVSGIQDDLKHYNMDPKEGYDTAADELDIFKNKPKCLLLDSHFALLEEIFNKLDKYEDFILIRGDFLYALRQDEQVKLFLDKPAVKLAKSRKTLTFDDVL